MCVLTKVLAPGASPQDNVSSVYLPVYYLTFFPGGGGNHNELPRLTKVVVN